MDILFNADDFGLTKSVTDGIVEAHLNGVVSSTTLMMNAKATEYAVTMAQQTPSLHVGIHLVLTWGKPLRNDLPGLTNHNGEFKYSKHFLKETITDLHAVKAEWQTQIEAFLKTGLPLHHIDSHHHIHGWEPLKPIILELAHMYQVPVRYTPSLHTASDILLTAQLYTNFYGDGVDLDIFEKIRQIHTPSIEVMTHPGYVDQDLVAASSYQHMRENELEALCHLKCPDWATII
ncbi:chitin disaccharide deacetylase [Gracilibacillus caseinilyticus]|uniref:Chitin disaccharide deacetylase n=1 Tax=Gracilibacillus caseinilyticus TaxID=2932256 RepID=A0ABY4EQI8_9BACI|nr:chitin disaccharide deacetylase [Gracilibacillus caseinilyticus]UOQ46702.1 chitin disaccharide deacetylase [Gracilibacillus caseinilyticus]